MEILRTVRFMYVPIALRVRRTDHAKLTYASLRRLQLGQVKSPLNAGVNITKTISLHQINILHHVNKEALSESREKSDAFYTCRNYSDDQPS